MEKQKRIISDPYLTAFIFLNLNIKPSPIVDDSGRVAFEFSDDENVEDVIRKFYADAAVSAFSYSTAVKSVKSIIFGMRSKNRPIQEVAK